MARRFNSRSPRKYDILAGEFIALHLQPVRAVLRASVMFKFDVIKLGYVNVVLPFQARGTGASSFILL